VKTKKKKYMKKMLVIQDRTMDFRFKLLQCSLAHQLNNLRGKNLNVSMFLVAWVKILVIEHTRSLSFDCYLRMHPPRVARFNQRLEWLSKSITCYHFVHMLYNVWFLFTVEQKWFSLYFSLLTKISRNYVPIIFSLYITP
jgi:hypothetical protein